MRDLLRRLIDSLSELTHWLGDREERQLSLDAVVSEVQAVARALERTSDPAELQGLTRRLHIVAAAAESEMKRTVNDLDQARHAAFRATVLAAELTIRSVRNETASPATGPGGTSGTVPDALTGGIAVPVTEAVPGGSGMILDVGHLAGPGTEGGLPDGLVAKVTAEPGNGAPPPTDPEASEQSQSSEAPRLAAPRPRGIRWLLGGGRPEALAG